MTGVDDGSTLAEEIARAISNKRRQLVICYLADREQSTLSGLTDWVSERLFGSGYTGEERKRVYVSLYQQHLDQLDSYEVVDYHQQRGEVGRGENFEAAREVLEYTKEVAREAERDD